MSLFAKVTRRKVMVYPRAKCNSKATTKTQTCAFTNIQKKGKKLDLLVLVFIHQIKASPKTEIHHIIYEKNSLS